MTEGQQAREAKQDDEQNDEQKIRALNFLTAGNMPMRREDYAAGFRSMIGQVSLRIRSNPQHPPLPAEPPSNGQATPSPSSSAATMANGASGAMPTCSPPHPRGC